MSELFLKILNMGISAGWLVLAVLVLRFIFRKAPRWIHVLLWGIVAVRLICPFSIESAFSLIPSAETVRPEIMMDRTPEISTGIQPLDQVVNPVISYSFAPEPSASANPLQILIPVSANLWLLGVLVMLLYTAVSYVSLRRKLITATLLRENIYQCETVHSPFVLGILKPRIYLPYDMGEQNLAHVIAHEQAHIHRKDHWWKPLGFLLLTVYWFHPLMWVAYCLLCRDIELACDEKVIAELGNDQRADYSQALVACSVNRRMIAACPLAFGEVGVKERIKSILSYRKPAFWVIVLAVVMCVAVAVCFLTNPLDSSDYLKCTGWSEDPATPNQMIYEINLGNRVMRGEIYVEQWTNGTCVRSAPVVMTQFAESIHLTVREHWDGTQATGTEVQIETNQYGGNLTAYFPYPEYYDGAYHYARLELNDRIRLSPGEEVILEARSYQCGNGIRPFTCETLLTNRELLESQDYMIVIRAVFDEKTHVEDEAPQATKWFDFSDSEQLWWTEELKCTRSEFPGITFKYRPYEIIATTSWEDSVTAEKTVLFDGMPIWNAYFCDLTGDGKPEICSQVTMGSGIIDQRVVIFDYASGVSYKLEDRGVYDYYLRLNDADGCLYVEKKVYNTNNLISSGRLVFRDGCIQFEGNSTSPLSVLQARILEIHDGYFLVEPLEGSWELNSAARIEVPMKHMSPSPEPQIGDILHIEYDGQIQETYPARISNVFHIALVRTQSYNASMIPTDTDLLGCPAGELLVPIGSQVFRYELSEGDPQGVTPDELLYTFTEETGIEGIVWEVYSLKEYPDKTAVLMRSGTNSTWLCRYSPPRRCSDTSLSDAIAAGYVVMEDGIATHGQDSWHTFFDLTQHGMPASVTVAHYYTLDKYRVAPEYYETFSQDYPSMTVHQLSYDGEVYTLTISDGGENQTKTFSYLMKFETTPFQASSALSPGKQAQYVLTHSNKVTWNDLFEGMVSSQMAAYIDHYVIYAEKYR